MKSIGLICALLALNFLFFLPEPAFAKKKGGDSNEPDIQITLSKEMQEKEDAFERERKKLSAEQKAYIEEMEKNFLSTVDPDVEIFKLASQIEACGIKGDEHDDAMKKFNTFRDAKNEQQIIMWGKFEQKYYPQVDFMEHQMLREHLAIKFKTAMEVAAKMVKLRSAQFDKGLQCEQAQKTLSSIPAASSEESDEE